MSQDEKSGISTEASNLALDLHHLFPSLFNVRNFPTLASIKIPSLKEEVEKNRKEGIPWNFTKWLDENWFGKGLRPCDSFPKGRDHSLWTLNIPEEFSSEISQRQFKKIGDRVPIKRHPVACRELQSLVTNIANAITEMSGIYIQDDQPSLSGMTLGEYFSNFKEFRKSTLPWKRFFSFMRFLFYKGHKFSKIEQCLTAFHMNILDFSDLQTGLFTDRKLGAKILSLAIIDPDYITKNYKAWVTNKEQTLFSLKSQLSERKEEVHPIMQMVLDQMMQLDIFKNVSTSPSTKIEYETTLKWISKFVPSRNLPLGSEDEIVRKYVKYISFLTTTTRPGSEASEERVRKWVDGPVGGRVEDFLSFHIANQILAGSLDSKSNSHKILKGASRPQIRLGTQSNFDFTRKKGGHIGENVERVLPFLEKVAAKAFPYIVSLDNERFICTDYGVPICKEEDGYLPLWQTAFLTTPIITSKKLSEEVKDTEGTSRMGMDRRYGTFLFLYATYHTRKWLNTIEMLASKYDFNSDMTEEELRAIVKEEKLPLPKERTVPVLEPGGKVRWVSSTEGALIYFQYPLAEDLRELYSNVEGARIGLTSDHHLYRFEESFADHTLHRLLTPYKKELRPKDVEKIYNDAKGDPILFEAKLHMEVAVRLALIYQISFRSALVSTLPLEEKIQDVILELMIEKGTVRKGAYANYREFENSVIEDPILGKDILTVSTNDMEQATDTIIHRLGKRNMAAVLGKVFPNTPQ